MRLTNYRFSLTNSLERLLDSKEQVTSVNEDLKFARRYLNLLVHRLNKDIDEKVKEDEATSNYDSPNWALTQAERLGYRRAMRKVLEILRPIEECND